MTALSILCACALLAPGGEDGALIHWGDRQIHLSALPPDLPQAARGALEAWAGWCGERDYRLDLDRAGRVLLVSREGNSRLDIQLVLASHVIERFDAELPAPAVRAVASAGSGARPGAPGKPTQPARKPLPEDPEEEAHPWTLEPQAPASPATEAWTSTWGAANAPLDSETVVLFIIRDQQDFELLLANLLDRYPYLKDWGARAKAYQGFVLGEPLAGCYLELPDGVEEWDPDHELVNRLARLCLLRRFGEAPNWFVQGYAWHMELALQHAVYCFPWRDEFVGVGEHSGWERVLEDWYGRVKLEVSDFAGWRRGVYQDREAKTSWGVVEYLLAHQREKLPALLDELRVFRDEHGRVQESASSWRRDLDYEIPPADQHALLSRHLGLDYLVRATFFFREELASLR